MRATTPRARAFFHRSRFAGRGSCVKFVVRMIPVRNKAIEGTIEETRRRPVGRDRSDEVSTPSARDGRARCGKPASGATAHPPAREGWASRSDTGGDTLGGRVARGGDPVLAFVGLNGAGKTALLHTLTQRDDARVSETPPRTPRDDDADGTLAPHLHARGRVLCAPPPTNAVEIRRARAAGTSFVAVDVPGVRADRLKWRLAIEREDADIVVFVVDAADHVRAPVAREESGTLRRRARGWRPGTSASRREGNHRDGDRTARLGTHTRRSTARTTAPGRSEDASCWCWRRNQTCAARRRRRRCRRRSTWTS